MDALVEAAKLVVGINLSKDVVKALKIFETELLTWNEQLNLTAIREPKGIRVKHFLDSLTILRAWERTYPPKKLIDIGTGAGFPGLVLKLVWPSTQVTLVESVKKKADFCHHMVEKLMLDGVTILSERAEVVGQDEAHRQNYDLAVARAVARMPILMEYLLPLVRHNGKALAMKGESAPAETHAASHAIQILGGKLQKLVYIELPGVVEERFIVVVEKIAHTPEIYPRRPGIPSKTPLS